MRLIRKKGGSRSPSPKRGRNKLREGAKVQARYRGRSKYYPGRIERDRGDGTYDIFCSRHRVYAEVFFQSLRPRRAASNDFSTQMTTVRRKRASSKST